MLRHRREQLPQLLWVRSLLIVGINGVDYPDSRLVYRARRVVCRPENHS
jgi:hypothetical protein